MPPQSLAESISRSCARWPERPAVAGRGQLSYEELGRAAHALAARYRELGVRAGDRVACALSNRAEQPVALAAAWLAGAVHVCVEAGLTGRELGAVVDLTSPRVLVAERSESLAGLRAAHPELQIALAHELADLAATHADGAPATPDPGDPAIIFISSGTTGAPKATIGYHGNLAQRWEALGRWLRFGPDDVHLAQLPLSHGFGLMMAVTALLYGGRLEMQDGFSAGAALRTIGDQHVTVVNGAPAHFRLLLDRLDRGRHNVASLRLAVGTAAAFPPPLVQAIWDRLGVQFMFMYGSSEGVGIATTDPEDMLRGSVGRPADGSVQIVGPDRRPLPRGATGEIAFSRSVFPVRYWSEREGPAASTNGWYYSGDLGRLDEDGRLYIAGRIKQQIDRGGLKVDPVEVESALLRSADVADAAVIAVPDSMLGERVCACVVPAAGQPAPSLDELRAALAGELAEHKLPEAIRTLDRIPRTAIGKIDVERLRVKIAERSVR